MLTVAVPEKLVFAVDVAVMVAEEGHVPVAVKSPVPVTVPLDEPAVTAQVKPEAGKLWTKALNCTCWPLGTLAEPGYTRTDVCGGGGGGVVVELLPPQAARAIRIVDVITGKKRSRNLERIRGPLSKGGRPRNCCALFWQSSSQVRPPGMVILIARFGAQSSAEIMMWPAPPNRDVSYPMQASQGYKNTVGKEELPWDATGRGHRRGITGRMIQ